MITKTPPTILLIPNSGLFNKVKAELTSINSTESLAFKTKMNALSSSDRVSMVEYAFPVEYETWVRPENVLVENVYTVAAGNVVGKPNTWRILWIPTT